LVTADCSTESREHVRCSKGNTEIPDQQKVGSRDALYAEFQPLIYRLMRQYGTRPELRQDLAGEIYCRFCTLLEAYDPNRGVPLRAYLVTQLSASIYTYARQHWRRDRREVSLEMHTAHGLECHLTQDPTPLWDRKMTVEAVREALPEALSRLTTRQRQAVLWRFYDGRSYEQIAQVLQVEPVTVRSLVRRALESLRRQLGNLLPGE
jgi:RNA polymerase sigma factor (sigma-70 family)